MAESLAEAVSRRRTFAIIAHPDAGKTTLTEKLLLFGGAIQLAGEVKAKKDRMPSSKARPPEGRQAPARMRARLVLPAPLWPIKARDSPGSRRKLIPFRICSPPCRASTILSASNRPVGRGIAGTGAASGCSPATAVRRR